MGLPTRKTKGSTKKERGDIIPDSNFNGDVTLSFDVSDGNLDDTTSATITVTGVNDPATIGGEYSDTVTEDHAAQDLGTVTATGQLTITDVDGAAEEAFLEGLARSEAHPVLDLKGLPDEPVEPPE